MPQQQPFEPRIANTNPPDDDGEIVLDEELLISAPDASTAPGTFQPVTRSARPARRQARPSGFEGRVLLGRYQVERVMARTAQEIVLQALHLELGQRVVLRYLAPDSSQSPEAIARFQRGARKARGLRSEHAERIVDFGRLESGSPYRAAELPNGPSLAEILRVRGALPIGDAVDIVLTVCEPVAEAHALGVVHRSLGTSNVYVERRPDGSPLVRVLDFGVSDPLQPAWGSAEEYTRSGAVSMTDSLPYAAPEQFRDPIGVDARADVWALGAILYELLSGAPAFEAETAVGLLAAIAADVPTPLGMLRADVPPELEALIGACLEKDPNARPRSLVDVAIALSPLASSDAQLAASRVGRMVVRSTRPPSLPALPPPSLQPPRSSQALVRSRPPARPRVTLPTTAEGSGQHGWGLFFAGVGVAAIAAVATVVLTRSVPPIATAPVVPAASPALPTPVSTANGPVVTAETRAPAPAVAAAPTVTPLAPVPPALLEVPPPLPAARPRPASVRRVESRPVHANATETPRAPGLRSDSARNDGAPAEEPAPKVTANATELFSGLD